MRYGLFILRTTINLTIFQMISHFSDSAVHGSPTALSLAHNTYIRTMRNNNPNHIRVTDHFLLQRTGSCEYSFNTIPGELQTQLSVIYDLFSQMLNGSPSQMDIRTVNEPLPPLAGEGRMGSSIAMMTLYLLGVRRRGGSAKTKVQGHSIPTAYNTHFKEWYL